MKRMWIFLVFCLVLSLVPNLWAQTAKIIDLEGEVLVKKDAASDWQKARMNMLLDKDAEVQTKKNSVCTLAFDEEQRNILTIKENSRIRIQNVQPGDIFLPEGRVFTLIENLASAEKFQIRTPTAIAGSRGTGWLTDFVNRQTAVSCFEDQVNIEGLDPMGNSTGQADLPDGFGIIVDEDGSLGEIFPLDEPLREQWNDFMNYTESLGSESQPSDDDTASLGDLQEEQQDSSSDIIGETRRRDEENRLNTPIEPPD